MACLNLTELRSLEGVERAFLEDAAKNIETVIANAKDSALRSGLDVELMERGLITTLIVTAASFAALYNKSADQEALAFTVMRCMAEALFDVMAFSSREDLERRLNLPKQ
jgi:hypothetical protein